MQERFIAASPTYHDYATYSEADYIIQVLDAGESRYPIDTSRIYSTGGAHSDAGWMFSPNNTNHGFKVLFHFVVENGKVQAAFMTQPLGDGIWEICKPAAAGQYTGTGAGSAVLKACIDYSIVHGAQKPCLITISGLKPAIRLYNKFGFIEIPYRKDVRHSEKADIEMEYIVPERKE